MINIKWIHLEKIRPLYREHVSKRGIQKRLAMLDLHKYLDLIMRVEVDPSTDTYLLVAGYPEYKAYLEASLEAQESLSIPCLIDPPSTLNHQLLKQLKRIFTYQHGFWIDKHNLICQLRTNGMSLSTIANELNLTTPEVEYYLIAEAITEELEEKAKRNNASFPVINQISSLNLHTYVKSFLFKRALLPRGHQGRLTQDKFHKLKWLLTGTLGFETLHYPIQIKILKELLDFKQTLINHWQNKIDQELQKQKQESVILLKKEFLQGPNYSPKHPS